MKKNTERALDTIILQLAVIIAVLGYMIATNNK